MASAGAAASPTRAPPSLLLPSPSHTWHSGRYDGLLAAEQLGEKGGIKEMLDASAEWEAVRGEGRAYIGAGVKAGEVALKEALTDAFLSAQEVGYLGGEGLVDAGALCALLSEVALP